MANLLVKEMPQELLAKVNYAAKMAGLTQTAWVIQVLDSTVNGKAKESALPGHTVIVRKRDENSVPINSEHDIKACRVYRCGQCAGMGVKDEKRGLR